jgi:hypothetical protein
MYRDLEPRNHTRRAFVGGSIIAGLAVLLLEKAQTPQQKENLTRAMATASSIQQAQGDQLIEYIRTRLGGQKVINPEPNKEPVRIAAIEARKANPEELAARSRKYLEEKMTAFEKEYEGLNVDIDNYPAPPEQYQCVDGSWAWIEYLGITRQRFEGPGAGFPPAAIESFRNGIPSILIPSGVTKFGQQYSTSLVEDAMQLQRGDVVVLGFGADPGHTGIFSGYDQNGSRIMLFDQNGLGINDPFNYHSFPVQNFNGAIRITVDAQPVE